MLIDRGKLILKVSLFHFATFSRVTKAWCIAKRERWLRNDQFHHLQQQPAQANNLRGEGQNNKNLYESL